MEIVDRGSGHPLVIVPGIQGRWEWLKPTLDAVAASFRVITFSLADEFPRATRDALGLDEFADQIESALNGLQLERAVICGVSFGGVIALRFAARRPERTCALILASTPGPGWRLRRSHEMYARWP